MYCLMYCLPLLLLSVVFIPQKSLAQGETTSAIDGQVTDATGAVVAGATVTLTSRQTGLKTSFRALAHSHQKHRILSFSVW